MNQDDETKKKVDRLIYLRRKMSTTENQFDVARKAREQAAEAFRAEWLNSTSEEIMAWDRIDPSLVTKMLEPEKPLAESVLQDWIFGLPFKAQTVLLLGLRGCDTAAKHDPGKDVTRALRSVVLKNASNSSGFMRPDIPALNMDGTEGMPVHWMMHLIHAVEVVGFMHPDPSLRYRWHQWYLDAVHKLHLSPETYEQFAERLKGDNGPAFENRSGT
jgi:hypothetical protein